MTLATAAGKSLSVNGVTRINTGAGTDLITITGVGNGTAFFNDGVFIGLGSGNDSLTIGNGASSPAFSSLAKFQFDGGEGVDTFSGSQTSISGLSLTTINAKLKSKITSFTIPITLTT